MTSLTEFKRELANCTVRRRGKEGTRRGEERKGRERKRGGWERGGRGGRGKGRLKHVAISLFKNR